MIIDRKDFAQFIERLIKFQASKNDWNDYAANHFQDALLEEVRRDVVRLMITGADSLGRVKPELAARTIAELEKLRQRLQIDD